MDGKIVIETEVETKGIDKGIAEIEKKMNDLRKKAEQPYEIDGMTISGDWNLSKEEQQYYDRLQSTLDQLNVKKAEEVVINNQVTNSIVEQQSAQEQITNNVGQWVDGVYELPNGMKLVKKETEDVADKMEDVKEKTEETKNKSNGIGDSINGIITKVGKWALALFGIRSAYSFIRSSMSTLSQYDEQLKADIEYIQFALAMAVKPVVEQIVNMAYELLGIVSGIVKALFGIDLFGKATKKDFKESKNNMKKTADYAEDIKKSLAGFDEMNILGDNVTSAGGNNDNIPEPSHGIDDWKAKGEEIGEKLKEVIEDTTSFWEKEWADTFFKFENNWGLAWAGVGLTLEGFYNIFKGIVDALGGLWDVLVGIFTNNEEKLKKGFEKLKQGIWEIVLGLGEIIAGVILSLFGTIVAIGIDLQNAFFKFVDFVINLVLECITWIVNNFVNGIKTIINFIASIPGKIAGFISGILNTIGTFLNNLKKKFKEKFDEIKNFMMAPINSFIDGIKNLWGNIKGSVENVANKIGEKLNPSKLFDGVKSGLSNIGNGIKNFFGFAKGGIIYPPKLAVGGIINQPGRGVPLTSAIGGEHGAEGVIPLTDSQQMQLLGEAIGKYITINASITNTMNGRVISRELQKVQNDMDFAMNR